MVHSQITKTKINKCDYIKTLASRKKNAWIKEKYIIGKGLTSNLFETITYQ